MGRCAGGQFAEGREKSGSGMGIVEGVKGDGRGKLRGFGAEADLKDVLLPNGHQSVEFRRGILFPMGASGEDDGTGFVEIPLPLCPLSVDDSAAVGAPAVTHDVEPECR